MNRKCWEGLTIITKTRPSSISVAYLHCLTKLEEEESASLNTFALLNPFMSGDLLDYLLKMT